MERIKAIARFIAAGDTIMSIYSYAMIGLSIYSTRKGKAIDSSVAIMYGSAITAYVGSKGYKLYETRMQKAAREKDPEGGYV